jgi:hypothetical protein
VPSTSIFILLISLKRITNAASMLKSPIFKKSEIATQHLIFLAQKRKVKRFFNFSSLITTPIVIEVLFYWTIYSILYSCIKCLNLKKNLECPLLLKKKLLVLVGGGKWTPPTNEVISRHFFGGNGRTADTD